MVKFYCNMTSQSGIYRITNTVNGKFYIGSSVNMISRCRHHLWHLRNKNHSNPILQRAFNKYGEDAFVCDIIETFDNPSVEDLLNWEQWYLDNTVCTDLRCGYNINRTTIGARNPSEETRQKMRESQLGKTLSKEHISKISESHKGIKVTLSPQKKQEFSLRMKQRFSKPIQQIDLCNNVIKIWSSAIEAAKTLNLCVTGIRLCGLNKQDIAHGYRWKKVEQ